MLKKSNTYLCRASLISILLVTMLLAFGLNNDLLVTEAKGVKTNTSIKLNNKGDISSLTYPAFKLPWDPNDNGRVLWTSGPHSWSRGGALQTKIGISRGSGLDFAAGGAEFTVTTMAAGTVIENDCGFWGLGCIVAIKHDVGGTVMIYAHLKPMYSNSHGYPPKNNMILGTHVEQATPIGTSGSSGTNNVHLHIDFRDGITPCYAPEFRYDGDDCGDIGWAGSPIGWDGQKLIDNYYIQSYLSIPDSCGDPECDVIFNYDGSAVKGGISYPVIDFPYRDKIDNNPEHDILRKIGVMAFIHPVFYTDTLPLCINTDTCEYNGNQTVFAEQGLFQGGGGILYSSNYPSQSYDTTAPTGSWISPSHGQTFSSSTVTLNVDAYDNSGGSGVREVRWAAKYNGQWYGVGTDYNSPYSITWDWCDAGVQDGDVELGFEVWDNANNKWVYSEHAPAGNIHIYKNYDCSSVGGSINWTTHFYNGWDHWWDPYYTGGEMCSGSFSQGNLDQNYGDGSPCNGGAADHWVGDYKATVNFSPGNYAFWVDHDDGLKLFVDGREIYSVNGLHSEWKCVDNGYLYLNGNHNIWAVLAEDAGQARVKVEWSKDNGVCDLPAMFYKSSPSNGSGGQPVDLTFSWGAAGGSQNYDYCIDSIDNNACDTSWINLQSNTSINVNGLNDGITYYWQVKAFSQGGAGIEADNGVWWSFATRENQPGIFNKLSPINEAGSQPESIILNWETSADASWYQYCLDTTNDNLCDGELWYSPDSNTSTPITNLDENTTYYWQIRASNGGGITYANNGSWWSFTTRIASPYNLLMNGGFEGGSESPWWWEQDAWVLPYSTFDWSAVHAHAGSKSLKITNNQTNDARWIQTVAVLPNSTYRLSGWIKTENVAHTQENPPFSVHDGGANLSVLGGFYPITPLFGTNGWTYTAMEFDTNENTQLTIAARVGMYGGITTGTAWFDDLELVLLTTPTCYTLTKEVYPDGAGKIITLPEPNCNNGTQFVHGTVVTITAVPNANYSFSSWSGTIRPDENPTAVTMTGNAAVAAYYNYSPEITLFFPLIQR